MANKIGELHEVRGFVLYTSTDPDGRIWETEGIYMSEAIAKAFQVQDENSGKYYAVRVLPKTYWSDGTSLYEVKEVGWYAESDHDALVKLQQDIRSKLTSDEWEVVNMNL